MTTRTRPYLIRDRDGDVLAVVRHCSGPAHAIRAYHQRLGLTAHVASADDAIAAVASGIAPPCIDCVENSGLRELFEAARAALGPPGPPGPAGEKR